MTTGSIIAWVLAAIGIVAIHQTVAHGQAHVLAIQQDHNRAGRAATIAAQIMPSVALRKRHELVHPNEVGIASAAGLDCGRDERRAATRAGTAIRIRPRHRRIGIVVAGRWRRAARAALNLGRPWTVTNRHVARARLVHLVDARPGAVGRRALAALDIGRAGAEASLQRAPARRR